MNRKKFLKISSVTAGLVTCLGLSDRAYALLRCSPFDSQGIQKCEVGISSQIANVVAQATGGQHMSQWCWAACIEMVFRYYGYDIGQETIVEQTWGSIVNLPSGGGEVILANLNRTWTDYQGRTFSVIGDSYTASPETAAQDLRNDMPLIIGTIGHAMVLTSLVYLVNQWEEWTITSAGVIDPLPGRGLRILSAEEWYGIEFCARIRVI